MGSRIRCEAQARLGGAGRSADTNLRVGNPTEQIIAAAWEMEADLIVKATKVKGVYTADPVMDPGAVFIPDISFMDVMTRDLRVMDAAAISLCKENEIPIMVLNIHETGLVARAVRGENVGTLVHL